MRCPCRGCPDRSEGCHGRCERYRAYDLERREIRREKLANRDVTDILQQSKMEWFDRMAIREKKRGKKIR